MITTNFNTNTAVNPYAVIEAKTNTGAAASIACCALSAAKAPSEAKELSNHSFPVTNWVFELEGQKYTLMMKDGQLVGKPFQVEHQEREYSGFMSNSLSQAIASVKSGEKDFALIANENKATYTHSILFMHQGEVKMRSVNFTQYGDKNNGEAIFPSLVDFYRHSVEYAAKYAVPVPAAV